jgi:hypothetical protein
MARWTIHGTAERAPIDSDDARASFAQPRISKSVWLWGTLGVSSCQKIGV